MVQPDARKSFFHGPNFKTVKHYKQKKSDSDYLCPIEENRQLPVQS